MPVTAGLASSIRAPLSPNAKLARLGALHYAFAVTGSATALLGPILPALSAHDRFNDVEAGRLFSAQFCGSFLVAILSSLIFRRFGIRRAATAAFIAIALGFILCLLVPSRLLVVPVSIYGAGLGLAIPATTLAVAVLLGGRSAPGLNFLNFTWCLGAVVAGPLATATVSFFSVDFVFAFLAFAGVFAAAAAWLTIGPDDHAHAAASERSESHTHLALAMLTGVLLFLYVGTETVFAGWTPVWTARLEPSRHLSAMVSPCFWTGILAARLIASAMLKQLYPPAAILTSLTVGGASAALMLAVNSPVSLLVGTGMIGFSFGAIFPTAVAIFCDTAGPSTSRYTQIIFASGALGGATLPFAAGWLVFEFRNDRAGLALAICCILAMIALQLAIRHRLKRNINISKRELDLVH